MTEDITIYQSEPDAALELLAQLDSRPCPRGRVLVAAIAGEPRAAVPLDGSHAIADPFHPTAALISLLELRAKQLNGNSRRGRAPFRPAALGRRRRGIAGLDSATQLM